jgi:hypothetical protein
VRTVALVGQFRGSVRARFRHLDPATSAVSRRATPRIAVVGLDRRHDRFGQLMPTSSAIRLPRTHTCLAARAGLLHRPDDAQVVRRELTSDAPLLLSWVI